MPSPPSSPKSPDIHRAAPSSAGRAVHRGTDDTGALRGPHHTRSSHLLHQLGDWSSKAAAGVTVACLLGAWFVVGVVTGHIALEQIKRTGEDGRGLALAGAIVGWASLGFLVLGVILLAVFLPVFIANLSYLRVS